jgi:hypothetical protein
MCYLQSWFSVVSFKKLSPFTKWRNLLSPSVNHHFFCHAAYTNRHT